MHAGHSDERRLTVNAAFLKDIKDDSRLLKSLFDRIEPLATQGKNAANHWPELSALLRDLCDQLAFHFSLEEAYGYFDSAVDAAPQLSTNAEMLRSQHPKLFESVRELCQHASELQSPSEEQVEEVLCQYRTFYQSFTDHEEAEINLILSALDDDIGVGD